MSLQQAPDNFLALNAIQTKEPVIVVDIDGLDYLTSREVDQLVRYGDPIFYGDAGIVYGGKRPVGLAGERGQRSLLSLDGSSLTISQKLEPEQGRAAVSTLSMSFVDKDQYMTQAISPGVIVDEILGRRVKVWLGYSQNSFPEDYYVIWRGIISQVNVTPGMVTLQFSDPNANRKQRIFYSAKTKLSANVLAGDTTISVTSNGDFHKKILGPAGAYDQAIKCYLKIEDELIEYQQTGSEGSGFGANQFIGVARGQRGSVAAAHAVDTEVSACLVISDHAIDMALKIMLSGTNGNFESAAPIYSFAQTTDPDVGVINSGIMLPIGKDAVRDYGLQPGDYLTVSGASVGGNNGQCLVEGFADAFGRPNQVILTTKTFAIEVATTATVAMRSQYDTYPVSCGVHLHPSEVDIGGHIYFKDTFLGAGENAYRFFIDAETTAKEFIETELFLPLGAYSLTRQGKLSMGYTKPPIADQRTLKLDSTNILNPQDIRPQRGINNRKYFNEIQWNWDYDDAGSETSRLRRLDTSSLSRVGISSALPISSKGSRTDIGFLNVVEKRSRFLLQRYSLGAVMVTMKTNFGTGNQVEAGDVVILEDNGTLQIANMSTGVRDYGTQLLEVIDRQIDLKTGQIQLTLLGGLEANINDRFATVAPSSKVSSGSTTSRVRIEESYGEVFLNREQDKWKDYVGLRVVVHNYNWSFAEVVTFTGFATDDSHAMLVSPPLSIAPIAGYTVDLDQYPDTTDSEDQKIAKLVHAYLVRTIPVISGVNNFSFNVNIAEAARLTAGDLIIVHDINFAQYSDEVAVQSVVGTLVTVAATLGFTPSAGMRVDLVPFKDGGGPYRFV